MITCQEAAISLPAAEKLPLPMYPAGLKYLSLESADEVQTPFTLPEDCPSLSLGDPVFLQHAKAGELCERFNDLWLVKDGKLAGQVKT
jgi:hypothetical protein